jgi:hypothetical protein
VAAEPPPFDLVVWATPRDLDADRAASLVRAWSDTGADPTTAPFDPSTDIGWFHRELVGDFPNLDVISDAVPSGSRTPIWMSGTDEAPARVVAVRLPVSDPGAARGAVETILSLGAKYDLAVFDVRSQALHRPLDLLAAHASATFWPRGAIRAGVAGLAGLAIAAIAWTLSIPVLSGAVIVVGAFVVLMAVLTFVHEGRVALRARRSPGR